MNLVLFSFHNTSTTWRKEKSIPGRKEMMTPLPCKYHLNSKSTKEVELGLGFIFT